MNLKLMDPEIIQKLIEGHEDILSPLAADRERFYKSRTCPFCQGNAFSKMGDIRRLFVEGDLLPRHQLKCDNCDCVFDPFSGLIEKMGNVAKAYENATPTINPSED